MRITKLLFLFFLIFCLFSCGNNEPNENNDNSNNQTIIDPVTNVLKQAKNDFLLPTEVIDDLELVDYYMVGEEEVEIYYDIDNISALDFRGHVTRTNADQLVNIKVTFSYLDQELEANYQVVVLGYSKLELLMMEAEHFDLPQMLNSSFVLPTRSNNEDITLYWTSNNEELCDGFTIDNLKEELQILKLFLNLSIDDVSLTKEYTVMCKLDKVVKLDENLNYLHETNEFQDGLMANLKIEGDYLVATADNATYLSPIYETSAFDTLVGSWSALANQESGSIELTYHVRINNKWTEYVSYGKWRLGEHNKGYSVKSKDKMIQIDEDIITVLNGLKADAFQYEIHFITDNNPVKLRLINTTINLNIADQFDENLPKSVLYDVPKLYQRDVPTIGGSICSPTSTTMLLKYYGFDFSGLGYDYEHQYMAWQVYDYGNMVFGNWTYNVAAMGAYGLKAYVGLFAGPYDLMNILANVGPVALSVKGNMQGLYTTAGHLLVCKGYRITDEGIVFICNDPNVKNVEVEYTFATIQNVWRNYAYVIVPEE